MKYHQGFYHPLNPKKYVGNPDGIVYRSGFEKRFFHKFDTNEHILEWGSEEICIPYLYPIDGKMHRYFPDCYIKYRTKDGILRKAIVEMKPSDLCKRPVKPKVMRKSYIYACNEFIKNISKWEAASKWCKERGWKFIIFTEIDLERKKD